MEQAKTNHPPIGPPMPKPRKKKSSESDHRESVDVHELDKSDACNADISSQTPLPAPRTLSVPKFKFTEMQHSCQSNISSSPAKSPVLSPEPSPAPSPPTSPASSPLLYACHKDTSGRSPVPAPRTMSASQLKSKDFDQIDSEPFLHRNLSNVDDQDSPKRPPVPPGKKPLISDLLKLADLNRTGSSNSDDANAGNDDVTFMERPLPPPPPSADKKPSISKLEKLAALEEIYSRDSDCNSTDNTEETISEECSDAVDENIYEEVKESLDEAQNIRPKNKLEHIANELLSTEEDYVKKLSLLVRFRSRVIEENLTSRMFSDEVVDEMFLNILNIYKFHQYFMLPELQQTLAEWESKQKLGDVMKQLAPYLKLTTEYVTNFDHARNVITEWQMKSPKFASIISSLEKEPACERLTLFAHMLEPIQRVPRYKMLLEDYLRHLPEGCSDKNDTLEALQLVTKAASHSNDEIRRRENVKKTLKIRESFCGNDILNVISTDSKVIKEGQIIEISAVDGHHQIRYLFLFNDVLLVGASRHSKYRLMGALSLEGMQIRKKDTPKMFQVRSKQRVVDLLASSIEEKEAWMEAIRNAIANQETEQCPISSIKEALGMWAPTMIKVQDAPTCIRCARTFGVINMCLQHHCQACGNVVCGKCSRKKMPLLYDDNRENRVCDHCYTMLLQGTSVKATDDSLFSGFLHASNDKRNWQRRYFAIHDDFVLYSFYDNEDSFAMTSVTLPGYVVSIVSETSIVSRENVIKLFRVGQKEVYYFKANAKRDLVRWMESLENAIQEKVLLCWQSSMLEETEC